MFTDEFISCLHHFMAFCGALWQTISHDAQFKAPINPNVKQSYTSFKHQIAMITSFQSMVFNGNLFCRGWVVFMKDWWG